MFTATDLWVAFIQTWVVGLAPALVARYVWKRAPLSLQSAVLIAGISCATFATGFMIARSLAGEPERVSLSWMLVFVASVGIMVSGKRADLVRRLQAMIADPTTTEERRALALDRLRRLEPMVSEHAPAGLPTRGAASEHDGELNHLAVLESRPSRLWLRGYRPPIAYTLAALLVLNVVLMASGYRFLIYERLVESGESYITDEWVFGSDERAVVVCWYWTGRSIRPTALKYGVGKNEIDECPLLADPREWD